MEKPIRDLVSGGLRSIAASIPIAGSFAQAWSELENFRFQKRITEFMTELEGLIRANEEKVKAVDSFVRASPEFADLLERTIRKVIVESDDAKRRIYATVFFSCVTAISSDGLEEKVDAIEALDSLNITDINCLKMFSSGVPVCLSDLFPMSMVNPFASIDENRLGAFVQNLAKLEARALISETITVKSTYGIRDPAYWANRWLAKTYVILPFGQTFLKYLEN